jgi:hypothetical protein
MRNLSFHPNLSLPQRFLPRKSRSLIAAKDFGERFLQAIHPPG